MLTNVSNFGALALDAQTIEYIWQVPILGMLMVFAVLGLLWAVLSIFKIVFTGRTPKEKKPDKASSAGTAQIGNDELIAVLSAAVAAHQNNDEIIAVLTAAVAAYRASEGETSEFRVVAFKRGGSRSWNSK